MTDFEFEEKFEKLMQSRREDIRTKYNRVLPSGEYIFNSLNKIIDKYKDDVDLKIYSGRECLDEMQHSRWSNWLEWDWAGIDATPSEDYINEHIDDNFIVIKDYADIEDPEYCWDYDWDESDHDSIAIEAIDAITEKNGFIDIDCQYGAGRNG